MLVSDSVECDHAPRVAGKVRAECHDCAYMGCVHVLVCVGVCSLWAYSTGTYVSCIFFPPRVGCFLQIRSYAERERERERERESARARARTCWPVIINWLTIMMHFLSESSSITASAGSFAMACHKISKVKT